MSVVTTIKEYFRAALSWIGGAQEKIEEVQEDLGEYFEETKDQVEDIIEDVFEKVDTVKNEADKVIDAIQEEVEEAKSMLGKASE